MYLYNKGKFELIRSYNEPKDLLTTRIKFEAISGDETESFMKMYEELYGIKYQLNYNMTREDVYKRHRDELIKEIGYVPKGPDDIRPSTYPINFNSLIKRFDLKDPVLYDNSSLPPEDFSGDFIIHDFDVRKDEEVAFLSFLGIDRRFTTLKETCAYLFINNFDIISLTILEPVRRYILIGKKEGDRVIDFGFPYQKKIYNPIPAFEWLSTYTLKVSKLYEDVFFYREPKTNIHFPYQNNIESYDGDPSFNISSYFVDKVRLRCTTNKSNISIFDVWEEEKYKLRQIFDLKERREQLFNIVKERKTALCAPFLPSVAKAIIVDLGAKTMLDMSAGWGDRMLGAIASNCEYVGFDPNTDLITPHNEILEMFGTGHEKIFYEPFENVDDFLSPSDMFDLVLSSPPFFTLEIYGTGNKSAGQSTETYPEFNDWLNKWLLPSMTKAFNHVKHGGHICIHIADFEKYHIISPLMLHMESLGCQRLPPYSYGRRNRKPIWTWKKL